MSDDAKRVTVRLSIRYLASYSLAFFQVDDFSLKMTVDAKAVVNCNRLKISDILRWWASHLLVVLSSVLKRFLKGFLRLFLSPRVFLRVHWPRLFYALSSCYMGWQQLLHIMIGRSSRGSPSFAMLSFPCCPPNSEENSVNSDLTVLLWQKKKAEALFYLGHLDTWKTQNWLFLSIRLEGEWTFKSHQKQGLSSEK